MDETSKQLLREAEYNVSRARNTSDTRELKSIVSTMDNILDKFNRVYDSLESNKKYDQLNASNDAKSLAQQMKGEIQILLANSY